MSELKRWGDDRPEPNRAFIVYQPDCDMAVMLRYLIEDDGEHVTWDTHTGKECYGDVHPNDRWCYVPDGPDWSKL